MARNKLRRDEKLCPRCAEVIKRAAAVCKHCGYEFSAEELGHQYRTDRRRRIRRSLVWTAVILLGIYAIGRVASTPNSVTVSSDGPETAQTIAGADGASKSDPTPDMGASAQSALDKTSSQKPSATRQLDIDDFQIAAEKQMRAILKDPDSAQYKDVVGLKFHDGYVFCGLVNAKNGFGGYTGFKHFVAAGTIAATEDEVEDFSNLWNQVCVGRGQQVSF